MAIDNDANRAGASARRAPTTSSPVRRPSASRTAPHGQRLAQGADRAGASPWARIGRMSPRGRVPMLLLGFASLVSAYGNSSADDADRADRRTSESGHSSFSFRVASLLIASFTAILRLRISEREAAAIGPGLGGIGRGHVEMGQRVARKGICTCRSGRSGALPIPPRLPGGPLCHPKPSAHPPLSVRGADSSEMASGRGTTSRRLARRYRWTPG